MLSENAITEKRELSIAHWWRVAVNGKSALYRQSVVTVPIEWRLLAFAGNKRATQSQNSTYRCRFEVPYPFSAAPPLG